MSVSGSPGTYVHSIAELRQYLPDSGTNFLWGITGVFLLVSLIVLIFCFTAPESDRVFHYL
ncbi:hypothetical protein B0A52_09600 [Exophiala mesophila]|uniref:Uncharacterized protein n=1 Tax=Exophiala mesophila TaxID=212818 RepID=A0A438MVJ0_EXOME|nr:hypothetical protein B0A52_09600 [Exophiala mesophila]